MVVVLLINANFDDVEGFLVAERDRREENPSYELRLNCYRFRLYCDESVGGLLTEYLVLSMFAQCSGEKDDRQNDSTTNSRMKMLRRVIFWAVERLMPSNLTLQF